MAGEGDIISGAGSGAAAGSVAGPWGALIGAGVGAAAGVFSYLGKQSQAAALEEQAKEELRRKQLADAKILGEATAAGAASGVNFDSASLQGYLSGMQAEMKRQQDWQRAAGITNANNLSTAASTSLFTDLGGTLSSYARANNYWRGG